jgi:hypothetical protein
VNQAVKKPAVAAEVDWSATAPVDRSKLASGVFKFGGLGENRRQFRISQRELGSVAVSIRPHGKEEWVGMRLWDFTSISFGLVYERGDRAWPNPAGAEAPSGGPDPISSMQPGDEVEIRIKVQGDQVFQIWCQLKNISDFKGGKKLGLRRLDINFPQAVDVERREAFRLPLTPSLSLNAKVMHPYIYGHWCGLRVSDVNKEMGLAFLSTDPSILIFEGMELQVHFELASHRRTPMKVRVTWVHAASADQVKFGAACVDLDWSLHNGLCDFLLYSRQWTPARLRQAGFRSQFVKSRLRFRSVKTMDDYAEVLELRRNAYVGAGKKPQGTTLEEMASKLDGQSRILMAHHQDKLVGTLTFTFPNSEDLLLDSEACFPGKKYPVAIPPKTNLIEVSRLCIHEEYRSTDLLQGMFEHGIKHFLLSDRHWLLSSAVAELLPMYERIGFFGLKASYRHTALNNQEHHLIMAHRNTFLSGSGMNPLVWSSVFGDLVRHLLDRGYIKAPGLILAWIRLKLLLNPLAKRFMEKRTRDAFRKHLDGLRKAAFKSKPIEPAPAPTED